MTRSDPCKILYIDVCNKIKPDSLDLRTKRRLLKKKDKIKNEIKKNENNKFVIEADIYLYPLEVAVRNYMSAGKKLSIDIKKKRDFSHD